MIGEQRESVVGLGQQECRPDPEQMLQRNRKRKESALNKLDDMKRINEWGNSIYRQGERELLALIGALTCEIWDCEKEEAYWLKEMDK